ncbi:hypothetical protein GQ53DRAFT_426230 [Thozetella sp. PMI_491]|nr:hypothetical protein GQ53DRAFT_426230 [Thozetella sp. PMI_491]
MRLNHKERRGGIAGPPSAWRTGLLFPLFGGRPRPDQQQNRLRRRPFVSSTLRRRSPGSCHTQTHAQHRPLRVPRPPSSILCPASKRPSFASCVLRVPPLFLSSPSCGDRDCTPQDQMRFLLGRLLSRPLSSRVIRR